MGNRNHGREANTRAERSERICTCAPPKRVRRAFALLTKTYHGSPQLAFGAKAMWCLQQRDHKYCPDCRPTPGWRLRHASSIKGIRQVRLYPSPVAGDAFVAGFDVGNLGCWRCHSAKRTERPDTTARRIGCGMLTELAFTENFSLHGVRVITRRAWKPVRKTAPSDHVLQFR